VVPEIRVADSPEEMFSLMKSGKIDFGKTVLALPSAGITPGSRTGVATKFGAEIKEYVDNRIVIDAHADKPACLLLNDKFDPEWSASVNGKPARIFRANFLMRGVEIPAGRSTVVFTYQIDRTPLLFSAASWGALIVFGCLFCLFPGRKAS
jgi:hypothetical protein